MTVTPGQPRLIIFAKAPVPGSVKTRLIRALGAEGAAALAQRMLAHVLAQAMAAQAGSVELCMSPAPGHPAWDKFALPEPVLRTDQGEGDLGKRMAHAVRRVMAASAQPVLLMGSDCPGLSSCMIREAASQLRTHDAVLLPVADGGYVLIGLKSPCPELFDRMAWSTDTVAAETLRRMAELGLNVWLGPMLRDIDDPEDLAHLPVGFSNLG